MTPVPSTTAAALAAAPAPAERRSSIRTRTFATVPILLVAFISLVTGVWGYTLFQAGSPTVPDSAEKPHGGLVLLFDKPGLSVSIDVEMNQDGSVTIRTRGSVRDANVLVVSTGSGQLAQERGGESRLRRLTVREGVTATAQSDGDLYADGSSLPSRYRLPGLVAGKSVTTHVASVWGPGHIATPPAFFNQFPDVVSSRLESAPSRVRGSYLVGAPPVVVAPDLVSESNFRVNSSEAFSSLELLGHAEGEWYPAMSATVNLAFSYDGVTGYPTYFADLPGGLPPKYRLDSSVPSTVGSNQLSWTRARSVDVNWIISDRSRELRNQKSLFLSGILIALSTGFLTVLGERLIDYHKWRAGTFPRYHNAHD